jgi:hypothetical protein
MARAYQYAAEAKVHIQHGEVADAEFCLDGIGPLLLSAIDDDRPVAGSATPTGGDDE